MSHIIDLVGEFMVVKPVEVVLMVDGVVLDVLMVRSVVLPHGLFATDVVDLMWKLMVTESVFIVLMIDHMALNQFFGVHFVSIIIIIRNIVMNTVSIMDFMWNEVMQELLIVVWDPVRILVGSAIPVIVLLSPSMMGWDFMSGNMVSNNLLMSWSASSWNDMRLVCTEMSLVALPVGVSASSEATGPPL